MKNSVDPDQSLPCGAVLSESALFSSLVRMYRKSYCTTLDFGIGTGGSGGGVDKMLKFYIKVFLLWAGCCQVSCPVCGQILFISPNV